LQFQKFPFPLRRNIDSDSPRRGKFKILPLIVFALFALYYYSAHQEVVPVTGRTQLVDISVNDEMALGLSSYNNILAQSDVVKSGQELDLIRKIGQRIAKVVDHKVPYQWEFNLIRSKEANAFALPGGKVAVYTGLLPIAQNEDGLATVMGHEIAHAIARHGAERMTQQKLIQYGSLALNMSVSEMDPQAQRMIMGAMGLGSQFGLILPYSRKHETEADYIGLIYLAKACFNPKEAPLLWERMAKANKGTPPEFLSTHPAPDTRIKQFNQWMNEAVEIRNKNC
jgi:predicted Zn-dependent protease